MTLSPMTQRRLKHLPNILSLVRILIIPFIVFFMENAKPQDYVIAAGLFLMAGATDILDGLIARHVTRPTMMGLYFDPLADKILLLSVSTLLILAPVPSWFSIFVMVSLTKEIFLSAVLGVATSQKIQIKPPIFQGILDGVLFFGLLFLLLALGTTSIALENLGLILTAAGGVLQIAAAIYYGRAFAKA